ELEYLVIASFAAAGFVGGLGYGLLIVLPIFNLPRLRTTDLDSLLRERLTAYMADVVGNDSHPISIALSIPLNRHTFRILMRFGRILLDMLLPNSKFAARLVTSYDQVLRLVSISRELQRQRNTAAPSTFTPGGARI